MAGKRSATSELNHDNWNDEEEPEERGTYKKASEAELSRRVIKTARRRNPISSARGDEEGKKSAFAGFTGFQNKPQATNNFSFLNNLSKPPEPPKTNGISNTTSTPNTLPNFNKNTEINSSSSLNSTNSQKIVNLNGNTKSDKFYAKLKGLNESVSKWITRKVEENPLISLAPIFKDYEKYLDEIETEEKTSDKSTPSASLTPSFTFKPANTVPVPDSTTEKSGKEQTSTGQFSFGSTSSASSGMFSFGSGQSTTQSTAPTFSFGSTNSSAGSFSATVTPFSFTPSASAPKEDKKDTENTDENEDEPPKVEFTPVIEKDHVYTTRCKVFIKKNDKFTDRGVGNLFLKPIENSEKFQLIVRADTNLGNLLLNFILSEAIPTKRMGKKDVMLVCIPMPDAQPPPAPVLLRVKSEEDADNLLETLDKHKK